MTQFAPSPYHQMWQGLICWTKTSPVQERGSMHCWPLLVVPGLPKSTNSTVDLFQLGFGDSGVEPSSRNLLDQKQSCIEHVRGSFFAGGRDVQCPNLTIQDSTYGGFHQWRYPQIIHFHGIFYYKPSILGHHHLWKTPISPSPAAGPARPDLSHAIYDCRQLPPWLSGHLAALV